MVNMSLSCSFRSLRPPSAQQRPQCHATAAGAGAPRDSGNRKQMSRRVLNRYAGKQPAIRILDLGSHLLSTFGPAMGNLSAGLAVTQWTQWKLQVCLLLLLTMLACIILGAFLHRGCKTGSTPRFREPVRDKSVSLTELSLMSRAQFSQVLGEINCKTLQVICPKVCAPRVECHTQALSPLSALLSKVDEARAKRA